MNKKELLLERQDQLFQELESAQKNFNGSDQERSRANKLVDELEDVDREIRFIKLGGSPTSQPIDLGLDDGNYAGSKGKVFRSFGDQLQAVYKAGRQGVIDPRLTQIRAATGTGETVPSDGGWLVEADFSREIIQSALTTQSNIASLIRTIPLQGNKVLLNAVAETSRATGSRWGGLQAFWLGEGATFTPTKPAFRRMEISLKKLCILCYATDELLEDSTLLDSTMRTGFAAEIAFMIDDGILTGTGVGSLLGIMNSNCLVTVTRATAGMIAIADIAGMWARAINPESSVWFASSTVLPTLYQMGLTVGASGVPIFMPPGGVSQTPYNTLFSRPIIVTEHNPVLGSKGDLILFNPSWYVLAVKSSGLRIDTSIHVAFLTDQSVRKMAAYVSNDIRNSSLIRGSLNSEKGMVIPSQATAMPWACVTTIQEPAYLN